MPFRTESISNRGGRESNQDCCGYLMLEDGTCWVVADGLGGHRGGEVASRIAVDAILASFQQNSELSPQLLERHLLAANNAIVREQLSDPALANMRTTVVVLLSDYRSFLSAYVGDSRLYYLQSGRIRYQSRDHSVPQVMVDAGEISSEQIRGHVDRNRILRSLGMEGEFRPVVSQEKQPLYNEDTFLLCVDGFWEHVFETEMEADLARSDGPSEWLSVMESRLRRRAEEGHDNYTAIAISFVGDPREVPPPIEEVGWAPGPATTAPITAPASASLGTDSRQTVSVKARRPGHLKKAALALGICVVIGIPVLLAFAFSGSHLFGHTTTLSNGVVDRLKVDGSWSEIQPSSLGSRGEGNSGPKRVEYQLSTSTNVRLVFISRRVDPVAATQPTVASDPDNGSKQASDSPNGNKPSGSSHPAKNKEGEKTRPENPANRGSRGSAGLGAPFVGLATDIGCYGEYSLKEFGSEALNGGQTYRAEIDCPGTGTRFYTMAVEHAEQSTIQEVVFEAPESEYGRHIEQIKHALKTIEWR
ncbi:MAG: PP2C family protein-serine/threonine phosphatase [Blastocatellia bacterium]